MYEVVVTCFQARFLVLFLCELTTYETYYVCATIHCFVSESRVLALHVATLGGDKARVC